MTAIPAVCVAILCGWFSWLVGRQFWRTRKTSSFFWFLSLLFSSAASLSYAFTVWTQPHSVVAFYLYYLLGAMWMPALMGLGSLALVVRGRMHMWATVVVCVLGITGSWLLAGAKVDESALTKLNGGAGVQVLHAGTWLGFLIALNSIGALCVFGVALVSAVQIVRRRASAQFFQGNVILALGIAIISGAGSSARLGYPELFWGTMFVGWVVTFWGYRRLTPRRQESHL